MPYEQPLGAVSMTMTTVQSATSYRQRKRSREIFAALVCEVTSRLRNESTVLHMIRVAPWRRGRRRRRIDVPRRGTLLRSGQYANSAKRYFVSSFRAKREIFVIRGQKNHGRNAQTGNLFPKKPSGIAPYILQRSCHHNPEP